MHYVEQEILPFSLSTETSALLLGECTRLKPVDGNVQAARIYEEGFVKEGKAQTCRQPHRSTESRLGQFSARAIIPSSVNSSHQPTLTSLRPLQHHIKKCSDFSDCYSLKN